MLSFSFRTLVDSPPRILCLGAHCDDIEIGCGGTLLTLLERYPQAAVRWVVFSGTPERAEESRRSAELFLTHSGEIRVDVFDYRDGFFPSLLEPIKERFEELAAFRPDLIFTHYRDDRHQDHRVVSDLTWNTFRRHCVLEYEIPKYDGDLGIPNFFVPLTDAICARKTQALLDGFPSQRSKQWFDAETFRAILRLRGMEANSPTRYAEAFYARKAVFSP